MILLSIQELQLSTQLNAASFGRGRGSGGGQLLHYAIIGTLQCNNIMATSQPKQVEEHFRETGKFKPISDRFHPTSASANFVIQHFEHVAMEGIITNNQGLDLWRVYLEEGKGNYTEPVLKQLVLSSLSLMEKNHGFDQSAQQFYSVGSVLLEKVGHQLQKYCVSYLDFNCVILNLAQSENKYILDLYPVDAPPPAQRDFAQEVQVKSKSDFQQIYLVQKNKALLVAKTLSKSYPVMELNEQYFQSSTPDLEKQTLRINNLSTKMVGLKFQDENLSKTTESLLLLIANKQIYQLILHKINRVRYMKYKVQEEQGKGSSNQHKKENKTTPDKDRNKHQVKVSMLSTIAVDDQQEGKKTIKLITQPRHLKISQRVATNPKESNLVPSENDYPVSVKDQKEKENPYLDQFQNLLYEEEGEEKQLALNDSFEQFQKREHSEKNMQIIKELAKRKEKETEEKKQLDSLKQKIKDLITEEKEWINKNLKLKSDIKKLKQQEPTDQNKEIQEIKLKILELKTQERNLIDQLSEIKKNNCIEVLVCGEAPTNSSQSQRGKEKILFHSINNLPVPNNFNPLTTSVRSNTGAISKFPQSPVTPEANLGHKANRSNFPTHNLNHPTFPGMPTQSFIQPTFAVNQSKPIQMGVGNNNDYMGYPVRQHMPFQQQQQGSVPFTSTIFGGNGGRVCPNPLGGKKPSVQVFPTYNNKN